jgi:ParB/RepB/Spo0J family partition protein
MPRTKGSKNKPKPVTVEDSVPKSNTPKPIVYLDISKLEIDGTNIRQDKWDMDPEFILDIKTNEVMNPLLVRPLKNGKYGVVAGSRRFNAAIDALKDIVPCIIEDLDDLHAYARSFSENYQRRGIKCWMYFKQLGKMYSLLVAERPTSSKNDLMLELENLTGKSRTNIQTIIDIETNLSEESKELLREPHEMSKDTKDKTFKYLHGGTNKPIDTHTAQALGAIKEPERQFETGVYASELPQTKALEFVQKVKNEPKEKVLKIFVQNREDVKKALEKPKPESKPTCSTETVKAEEEDTPAIVHPSENTKPFDVFAEFKNSYCEGLQNTCLYCPDYKTCKEPCKYTIPKKPKKTQKLEAQIVNPESDYVTEKHGHTTVAYKKPKA